MSVVVKSVEPDSPAEKAGLLAGDILISMNKNEIMDVLDYRFYQEAFRLNILVERDGRKKHFKIKKDENEELGLCFETYLMDKQHSCKNNCIFCFIDQMPRGMRKSLYFKDDDSRLSFLFGNYITLTNITEHEVKRIIKMHISPINISVHTTNPELRCKMMHNRFAGDALSVLYRLAKAKISINCQLVLCPGYNDKEELERSLRDLTALESVRCIAAVPVGLTGHREGLAKLEPFNENTAENVLRIMDKYGEICLNKYGQRRVFAADEFYLIAGREIPTSNFYEDFLQLENGVGMWAMLRDEAYAAIRLKEQEGFALDRPRKITVATGEAAYLLLKNIVDIMAEKWHNLSGEVIAVKNNFFGGHITVTGLVTGGDLIEQLKSRPLGEAVFISAAMLRHEKDKFLDDLTVADVEKALGVPVITVESDGYELVDKLLGCETN